MRSLQDTTVAVVGLGYVGFPLAVEFGKKYTTIGYDLSSEKIDAYRQFIDPTGEVESADIRAATGLECTNDPNRISSADFIVVAVPTPVDKTNTPDLSALTSASATVGKRMKSGAIVVYESTVYPGATEEICVPILERESSFKWRHDFHVGYSPERVNPGDKERTITKIIKVVSGDDEITMEAVGGLYSSIISAGVYCVKDIKVAEAAKVIENTQRDLNIALMNELAIIFNKVGIDTQEVLKAAGTKWNFMPFSPGLVGGHCIGVDPYYLTHKAAQLGYESEVILAGRRINDGMAVYAAEMTLKLMSEHGCCNPGDTVIVLGLTFKEDCPDLRNSKVVDLIRALKVNGLNILVHDPIADPAEALREYGLTLTPWEELPRNASAIVAAVSHQEYCERPLDKILELLKPMGVFSDVKSKYDASIIRDSGHVVWRL
jgi:UDP-N-acetyl-D-glucosamine/UDP-N-acetyl-D-galactosamine dehydrogenase